ncbi:unnamed protein product [Trichogramma brassicae]|uniref:Uncharacterized protein n=1 Tax=Trichogramma brassicae TaxID=86971 RepID=A0A6H5IME7_9HYME|nr:unnamed protein product [Trichogramma brassicae]
MLFLTKKKFLEPDGSVYILETTTKANFCTTRTRQSFKRLWRAKSAEGRRHRAIAAPSPHAALTTPHRETFYSSFLYNMNVIEVKLLYARWGRDVKRPYGLRIAYARKIVFTRSRKSTTLMDVQRFLVFI